MLSGCAIPFRFCCFSCHLVPTYLLSRSETPGGRRSSSIERGCRENAKMHSSNLLRLAAGSRGECTRLQVAAAYRVHIQRACTVGQNKHVDAPLNDCAAMQLGCAD